MVTAPNFETITVENRIKGYERALTEVGIPIDRSIWFTEVLLENPVERAMSFFQRNPDMTAVFAMNAYAGQIAFQAAKRLGRKMPEEFSISSFDQEHELDVYPIYTAKQDSFLMGEKAVELLELQLKKDQSVQRIVLPVSICFKSEQEEVKS